MSSYAPSDVLSVVKSSTGAVQAAPGHVFWLTVSNAHATDDATVTLDDSTGGGGTSRWSATLVAGDTAGGPNTPLHCVFDPPIRFATGIYATISAGTVLLSIGYN